MNKIMLKYTLATSDLSGRMRHMYLDGDQHLWQAWAEKIHRWGFETWVASFLEEFGPLTILGAQIIYMAMPFLNQVVPETQLDAAARLMSDTRLAQAFARMLRENNTQ